MRRQVGISSFEALSDVGESHCEGLHSRKGILEIQDVGIAVNPAKLHHLHKVKQTRTLGHAHGTVGVSQKEGHRSPYSICNVINVSTFVIYELKVLGSNLTT